MRLGTERAPAAAVRSVAAVGPDWAPLRSPRPPPGPGPGPGSGRPRARPRADCPRALLTAAAAAVMQRRRRALPPAALLEAPGARVIIEPACGLRKAVVTGSQNLPRKTAFPWAGNIPGQSMASSSGVGTCARASCSKFNHPPFVWGNQERNSKYPPDRECIYIIEGEEASARAGENIQPSLATSKLWMDNMHIDITKIGFGDRTHNYL
ncbi:hypothetical protein J1605_010342 [Eschrichtius robustus]|uniref:CUB domain-containing protein n=1 Tax=Eschrichtius robustus TaxID=9764 RepID=A0AB34GU25_ESCRO|nr:hypothetical protein J1605_010342 [Eschrichtius robustus]